MRSLLALLVLFFSLPSQAQLKVTDANSLRKQVLEMAEGSGMTPWEVIQGLKEGFQTSSADEEDVGHGNGSNETERVLDESLGPIQGWLGELEEEFMRSAGENKDEKKLTEITLDPKNVTALKPTDSSGKEAVRVTSNTNNTNSAPKISSAVAIPFPPQTNPNLSVQNSLKAMLAESNRQEVGSEKPKRPMEIKASVIELPMQNNSFSGKNFLSNSPKPIKKSIAALAKMFGYQIPGLEKELKSKKEKVVGIKQAKWHYPLQVTSIEEASTREPANQGNKLNSDVEEEDSDLSTYETFFGCLGWGFAFFILFLFLKSQKKKDELKGSQI
jgi:hypothetical protein